MGQQFRVRSSTLVVTLSALVWGTLAPGSLTAFTSHAAALVAGGEIPVPACVGDCNADMAVTIAELVAVVSVVLGRADVDRCPRADTDQNSRVTIDELVGAVNRALDGCGAVPTATFTPTGSRPPAASPTLSPTRTATSGGPPGATQTPTGTSDRTPDLTHTATVGPTATGEASPAITPTPIASPDMTLTPETTATDSPTAVLSPTPTATATPEPPTPTPTTPPAPGPGITYFGVVRADAEALQPDLFDPLGRPVFVRVLGHGMSLIVEAQPGTNARPVGESAFSESGFPDLQMLVSRPLGDGRAEVCDVDLTAPDLIGGVPATPELQFADAPAVVNATNDLGCRVDNGKGQPIARTAAREACTRSDTGDNFGFGFVNAATTAQFCLPIASKWEFQAGDTVVKVRVRGNDGVVGPSREVVIRVTGQP